MGVVVAGDDGSQPEATILQTINASLVEIYSNAPSNWISVRPRAELIRPPTTVSITVTQDSKTITFGGYQSWMLECTVIISGDAAQNQFTIDGSAAVSLAKPYNGTSGTFAAIVYQDSVMLAGDVFRIGNPVQLDQAWGLRPVDTVIELQKAQPGIYTGIGPYYGGVFADGYNHGTTGFAGFSGDTVRTLDKRVERPFAFRSARAFGYHAAQCISISLSALPDQRYTLDYQAHVIPFVSSLTDTSTPEYLPFHNDETILVPWMRYKFADQPHVTMNKADLKPAFDGARDMLKRLHVQPYRPQFVTMGQF